jgi:ribosomal protein L14
VSYPGDFILISVKRLRLVRKVRVGQIHLALFIRSRKETRFLDGSSSRAEENAVILMNKKKRILGTRLFG